jgi:hypothetical protein
MTGRPRSPSPRRHQVGVRLTDAERARLEGLAGRGGIAEYLRAAAFGQAPRLPLQVPPVNADAWRALAPGLANLNQLTRLAHEGRAVGTDLLPVLDDVRRRLVAVRAALIGAPAAPGGGGER